ncbi:MAG: flavodoxin family protein [Arenicella sp.]
MSYLLIVANTPSDNTLVLRDAVLSGAQTTDFPVRMLAPLQASAEDVLGASGVILGTTENFGYMSGQIKDFLERIYYPCLEETQGMPWTLYVVAGLDGTGATKSLEGIIGALKWRKVQPALLLKGGFKDEFKEQCQELGAGMATGLDAGIF